MTHRTDRAVSPVVGVVVLVAIVVALAAVVGAMAVGFQDGLEEPPPNGGFDREYVPSGADNTDDRPYVRIVHQLGRAVDAENVVIKDDAGNTVRWVDVWTAGPQVRAGEYVQIDGFGSDSALDPICAEGDTYYVIVEDDDDTLIIEEWRAPRDPALPAGSSSDSDGDGIPDWC